MGVQLAVFGLSTWSQQALHVSETNSRALAGHGENNDTDVVKVYVSKK